MNPIVPSQRFVNHFRTRQFDGREIVEFESSVDWSSEASTSAALDLISTFLHEGDPLTGKLLWLNGDCFLFKKLPGYMQLQHEVSFSRQPNLITDQLRDHNGIHDATLLQLDLQVPRRYLFPFCACRVVVPIGLGSGTGEPVTDSLGRGPVRCSWWFEVGF